MRANIFKDKKNNKKKELKFKMTLKTGLKGEIQTAFNNCRRYCIQARIIKYVTTWLYISLGYTMEI